MHGLLAKLHEMMVMLTWHSVLGNNEVKLTTNTSSLPVTAPPQREATCSSSPPMARPPNNARQGIGVERKGSNGGQVANPSPAPRLAESAENLAGRNDDAASGGSIEDGLISEPFTMNINAVSVEELPGVQHDEDAAFADAKIPDPELVAADSSSDDDGEASAATKADPNGSSVINIMVVTGDKAVDAIVDDQRVEVEDVVESLAAAYGYEAVYRILRSKPEAANCTAIETLEALMATGGLVHRARVHLRDVHGHHPDCVERDPPINVSVSTREYGSL